MFTSSMIQQSNPQVQRPCMLTTTPGQHMSQSQYTRQQIMQTGSNANMMQIVPVEQFNPVYLSQGNCQMQPIYFNNVYPTPDQGMPIHQGYGQHTTSTMDQQQAQITNQKPKLGRPSKIYKNTRMPTVNVATYIMQQPNGNQIQLPSSSQQSSSTGTTYQNVWSNSQQFVDQNGQVVVLQPQQLMSMQNQNTMINGQQIDVTDFSRENGRPRNIRPNLQTIQTVQSLQTPTYSPQEGSILHKSNQSRFPATDSLHMSRMMLPCSQAEPISSIQMNPTISDIMLKTVPPVLSSGLSKVTATKTAAASGTTPAIENSVPTPNTSLGIRQIFMNNYNMTDGKPNSRKPSTEKMINNVDCSLPGEKTLVKSKRAKNEKNLCHNIGGFVIEQLAPPTSAAVHKAENSPFLSNKNVGGDQKNVASLSAPTTYNDVSIGTSDDQLNMCIHCRSKERLKSPRKKKYRKFCSVSCGNAHSKLKAGRLYEQQMNFSQTVQEQLIQPIPFNIGQASQGDSSKVLPTSSVMPSESLASPMAISTVTTPMSMTIQRQMSAALQIRSQKTIYQQPKTISTSNPAIWQTASYSNNSDNLANICQMPSIMNSQISSIDPAFNVITPAAPIQLRTQRPVGLRVPNGLELSHSLTLKPKFMISDSTFGKTFKSSHKDNFGELKEKQSLSPMPNNITVDSNNGNGNLKENVQPSNEKDKIPDKTEPELWLPPGTTNPTKWNVDQVCEFISHIEASKNVKTEECVDNFRKQMIDGQALFELNGEHLAQSLDLPLGPALRIGRNIKVLKTMFEI